MTYKQIKKEFKKIKLGIFKDSNGFYTVYFLTGIQQGNVLARVPNLISLEELLGRNKHLA